ncbi:NADH-quinone oxidoreductase subunit J [candidate division KSB1 bacterium]|nr:NADH-quinone oxidoreductase subunit J [candidate division KSB1 bacterium]
MDFNILMYLVFGILAVAGGAVLLLAKHPVRGALGLLGTMLCLAGMYATLNAHAIAAFQVIIYAGAVMVLITYIIMLLDIRSEDFLKPFARYSAIGLPVIVVLTTLLLMKFMHGSFRLRPEVGLNPANLEQFGTVRSLGEKLIHEYVFAFEYISTLLFAAIVAVIAVVQLDWKGHKKHES